MYRLKFNLGRDDAKFCNRKFGASLDMDKLAAGTVIDLPDEAERFLSQKYPALLESAGSVRAVAPKPAITAPRKADEPKSKDD